MPPDDSYLRHQQQRWTRHDAHLWLRHDAARFLPPSMDVADRYPTLERKPDPAKQAAFDAELAAEVAHGYRLNAALRAEFAKVKADMAGRRAAYSKESKYSPSQPRVPAGNPDGGQWTDGGSASRTQSLATDASRRPGVTDPRVISDADPEAVRAGDQYVQAGNRRSGATIRINGQTYELTPGQAARLDVVRARAEDAIARVRKLDPEWKPSPSFYSSPEGLIRTYEASAAEAQTRVNELTGGGRVDLMEEQQGGGHPISEHAARTRDYLKSRARDNAQEFLDSGREFRGVNVGSSTSVQSANRLVNSTISENQYKIDQAIQAGESSVVISKNFTSPTGYEAYLSRAHGEPYIRDTFGVKVVIRPDPGSARGWRVQTAYPIR